MSREESGGGAVKLLLSISLVFAAGMVIGRAIGEAGEHTPERVRAVQEYNAQLHDQLAASRAVGHLILNDEADTFSFQNETDGNCTGKYEVHDDLATVVGPLACTHTLPLPQPS